MLRALGLGLRYSSDVAALHDVSAEFAGGELCAVVGPNGAGKSSLLRCMAGLLAPTTGSVELLGDDPRRLPRKEMARRVAWVAQRASVPGGLRVFDLVGMARYAHLQPFAPLRAADRAAIERSLSDVDAARLGPRLVCELSGGELQRVLLARAFAQDTPCLLLDEPLAGLDPAHQLQVLDTVRAQVDGRQRCAILVTHDLNLAAQFADRVLLLAGGRVAAKGPPAAVLRPEVMVPVYGEDLAFGALRAADGAAWPWVIARRRLRRADPR